MSKVRDRVLIAEISAAHGLYGATKLKLFCASLQSLTAFTALQDDDGKAYTLVKARQGKNDHEAIVDFAEVSDRTEAESLRGKHLMVERALLPETETDEYYHADLIGLAVHDVLDDRLLGHVHALYNFGAGDILKIMTAEGIEFMHPFRSAFVPSVDVTAGKITVTGFDETTS
ncbi:MAG: 16S rRNA processing protein RimM [Alphaproteobacteria bacterium]|nr:16S rRNA processing protein RimM [Alphaproteobacteria bacterium]